MHPLESAYKNAMRAYRTERRTARMEVNHIEPALGRHNQLSCAHHLDNLETLCPPCHKTITAAQRVARDAARGKGAA